MGIRRKELVEVKDIAFEVKNLTEDGTFDGYASTFGNIDAYDDTIERGAFSKTIAEKVPVLLWQHNTDEVIGVIEKLVEDDTGLFMKGRLLIGRVARATEAYELLKAEAINGLSIGYCPVCWEYRKSEEARWGELRVLKEIDLWEVSLVTFPADRNAGVSNVKSYAEMGVREIEETLRDAGFSRAEAKALISRTKTLLRDAEEKDDADSGEGKDVAGKVEAEQESREAVEAIKASAKALLEDMKGR